MSVFPTQDSFVRGEISPRLHARASLELYRSSLAICENFITLPHGGIRKRSGTYFAGHTKAWQAERPRRFVHSSTQAYCLFFGDGYFRVYAYGGPVLDGSNIVEVVTPYDAADVPELQFRQSGDVLYVTHPSYNIRKITRVSNTEWTIDIVSFADGPFSSGNADKTVKMYASATTGSVTLTANSAVFDSSMIGQLVKIQVETFEAWKPWESGGFLAFNDVTLQDDGVTPRTILRRYNGNIYEATEPTATGHKIFMGGTPPTHLEGSEWDGAGEDDEDFSNADAEFNQEYGVKWEYKHSGFGIAEITAIGGGGTTATATVLTDFPSELVGSGNSSYRWSIGAFGGAAGLPRGVTINEERLLFGLKQSVYGSKTFDFTSFRTGSDADDALAFTLAGAEEITWLDELDGFLIVGTIGGVRALSGANDDALQPNSFKNRGSPTKRCSTIQPVKAGAAFVYVGYDRRSLVELNFSLERNGFQSAPLALISEHIPKAGISSLAYHAEPDSIFWVGLNGGQYAGHFAGLTYEQDQNVRGWHRHKLGGSFGDTEWGVVEYVETTPGQSGADDTWLVVKRTIQGVTRRYIEVLQPGFEYGAVEDAFMVDAGLTYEGAATGSFTAEHLAQEFCDILADGIVYKNVLGSVTGEFTLPGAATATKAHIGLPYTATAETLELDVGGRDGSTLGRRKKLNSLILSVLESANITVRSAERNGAFVAERAGKITVAPASNVVSLFTGNLDPVRLEDTWAGRGRIRIECPDPVPATIRAVVPEFDSEAA